MFWKRIADLCTGRCALVLSLGAIAWAFLLVRVAEQKLVTSFDGRWRGYDFQTAIDILDKLKQTGGANIYLWRHFPLDMVFPFLYGSAIAATLIYLLTVLEVRNRGAYLLSLAPLAGALADLAENLVLRNVVAAFAESGARPDTTTIMIASLLTQTKWALLFIGLAAVLVLALILARRRLTWAGVVHGCGQGWLHVRYAFWLVWLARVSAASALVGFLLFTQAPQAQDLFLEIKENQWWDRAYWTVFAILLVFGWVQAVHVSAEKVIERCDDWCPPTRGASWIQALVPIALGSLCYIGLIGGELNAMHGLIDLAQQSGGNELTALLGLELTALSLFYTALLVQGTFILLVLYILFQLFRAADIAIGWRYVLVGFASIIIGNVLVGFLLDWFIQDPGTQNQNPLRIVSEIIFLYQAFAQGYTLCIFGGTDNCAGSGWLGFVDYLSPSLALMLIILILHLTFQLSGIGRGRPWHRGFAVLLTALTISFFVVDPVAVVSGRQLTFNFAGSSHDMGHLALNRAHLVVLVLGAWVPALTYLAWLSRRTKAPLLGLLLVFALAGSQLVRLDFDVPRVPYAGEGSKPRQVTLNEAVKAWKQHNWKDDRYYKKCKSLEEELAGAGSAARRQEILSAIKDSCPRPIVVAAAGGASRAGFFTASALGRFIDETQTTEGPQCAEKRGCDFRDRLFAISSVSGSSVGAAVFSAALEDSIKTNGAPPCSDQKTIKRLWFQYGMDPTKADTTQPWADCMQLILSGDFLSPAFISLGFLDSTKVSAYCFGNRGFVLESAWADRYSEVIAGDASGASNPFCIGASGPKPEKGLNAKFTSYAPLIPASKQAEPGTQNNENGKWRPLLLFNSTSVETGRRVLVSHLKAEYEYCIDDKTFEPIPCGAAGARSPKRTRLSADTYDLFQLFNSDKKSAEHRESSPCNGKEDGCDITLGSAALTSALFPFISPHLNVVNSKGYVVDRVVDGGYFESYGATTALDVVVGLKRLGLEPIVVLITNDPEVETELQCVKKAELPVPAAQPPQNPAFLLARAPIQAVINARSARGNLAAVALCEAVAREGLPSEDPNRAPSSAAATSHGTATAVATDGCPGIAASESFAHLRVYTLGSDASKVGDAQTLSMSWWLSKPLQQHLDWQLRTRNGCVFERLKPKIRAASALATLEPPLAERTRDHSP